MSSERPLRGQCHCGRNQYIIQIPQDTHEAAQVLFDTSSLHRQSSASPLAAFLRIPLAWYHSTTYAFLPDETGTMVRRVYTHPAQPHAKRQFCGICGCLMSYWSEEPPNEADYIQLALGSLLDEDFRDLEEMGMIPEPESPVRSEPTSRPSSRAGQTGKAQQEPQQTALSENSGVPWFDSMVAGSQLGRMRTSRFSGQSQDGRVKVEWEITEWTGDDSSGADAPSPAKRPKQVHGGEKEMQDA